ncbi:asparaginase [Alkalithermobacter paradoxus]|uniref:L-asparaginase II n=1 Tax=Alkalithermobacter paradoxus TaxID=29349 RepID=A0A1V4IB63_9FIRM|nr:L-asparaginase II [[Clostridium] thermoalcaliphilum]
MSQLLVHAMRGDYVESRHYGDLVIVNRNGKILYSVGDHNRFTLWRSAAKPFQVIPFVESGGVEKFNITMEELSVMTSSHGGENKHINAVNRILNKLNVPIESLDCGIAPPMYSKASAQLLKSGKECNSLHNACSGKHSAMIGLAIIKDICPQNYININHPVQKAMLNIVSEICDIDENDIAVAIDGCGVPVFGMGIDKMALAYAKLSMPDGLFSHHRTQAMKKIVTAMTSYPFYVAGTDRLDTALMKVTKGRLVAKLGAEAVYNVGIVNEGIGICLKIDDGNVRAIDPVIIETLKQLDLLSYRELNELNYRHIPLLKNHRKEVIGKLKPVFSLNRYM